MLEGIMLLWHFRRDFGGIAAALAGIRVRGSDGVCPAIYHESEALIGTALNHMIDILERQCAMITSTLSMA
jgi:hypothetical protein